MGGGLLNGWTPPEQGPSVGKRGGGKKWIWSRSGDFFDLFQIRDTLPIGQRK